MAKEKLRNFNHVTFVTSNYEIGEGTTIGKNVVIGNGVKIGKNVVIGDNVVVQQKCIIGDDSEIGNGVVFGVGCHLEHAVIEDNVIVPAGTICEGKFKLKSPQ